MYVCTYVRTTRVCMRVRSCSYGVGDMWHMSINHDAVFMPTNVTAGIFTGMGRLSPRCGCTELPDSTGSCGVRGSHARPRQTRDRAWRTQSRRGAGGGTAFREGSAKRLAGERKGGGRYWHKASNLHNCSNVHLCKQSAYATCPQHVGEITSSCRVTVAIITVRSATRIPTIARCVHSVMAAPEDGCPLGVPHPPKHHGKGIFEYFDSSSDV